MAEGMASPFIKDTFSWQKGWLYKSQITVLKLLISFFLIFLFYISVVFDTSENGHLNSCVIWQVCRIIHNILNV